MMKKYAIKTSDGICVIGINWGKLDPVWSENSYYGPSGRYVTIDRLDKAVTYFFRNPLTKPLLHNGRKSA